MNGIYFLKSSLKKSYVYILKPCREVEQSLEESLRGSKLVKNFEIFRIGRKTVISFGFRVM